MIGKQINFFNWFINFRYFFRNNLLPKVVKIKTIIQTKLTFSCEFCLFFEDFVVLSFSLLLLVSKIFRIVSIACIQLLKDHRMAKTVNKVINNRTSTSSIFFKQDS